MYDIIFASLEALFKPRSWFWQQTVRYKNNELQHRLCCIAIDEADVIWDWQVFWDEYQILDHLKDVFSSIPTLLLSATITSNILEYIRVLLKLFPPSRIYRQPLDWPNLTYIVSPICKLGFKNLDFLVLSGRGIGNIPKTMILVDSIDEAKKMAKHLQLRLSERVQNNKKQVEVIICMFSSMFSLETRTRFLADLQLSDTRIWIYIKCTAMGINLCDIRRAV